MDFRQYLELEAALSRKLRKEWQPQATAVFDQINSLIAEGKFDEASQAAYLIDFSEVGESCRQYIKYLLQSCIYFGGAIAKGKRSPGGTFVSAASHESLLDHVTSNFLVTLNYNVTQAVQADILHSIAQVQSEPATKAEKVRYVKDFVSFQRTGDDMLKLVSSLHTSRLSTWGFTAEADVMGYEQYELSAVLDGRTSDFCRAINGKKFYVSDAKEFVNKVLMVQNPDDVKVVQPWPKQDKASIQMFREATAKQLTEMGLHIPPFHPFCRTMCVRTDEAPKIQAPYVAPEQRVIDPSPTDVTVFQQMGVSVTQEQAEFWTAYLPVSPVEAMARMSGTTGKDVISRQRKNQIVINPDGNVRFNVDEEGYRASITYDPFSSALYFVSGVFMAANAAASMKKVFNGMADVGVSIGAQTMNYMVSGDTVRHFANMGFTVSPATWYDLKNDIQRGIDVGEFPLLAGLTPEQMQAVTDVLSSRSESGLNVLLALPFRVAGFQIGEYLLGKQDFNMSLNLSDPDTVAYFREAMQ